MVIKKKGCRENNKGGMITSSLSITCDIERVSPFKVLALSKIPF